MDIQLEKYKLVEWLIQQNSEEVIEKLKNFKESFSKDTDWNYDISETEKLFVEAGLKDIKEGITTTLRRFQQSLSALNNFNKYPRSLIIFVEY